MPKISPKLAICIVYVAAMMMDGLDATIVGPALLAIGGALGVSPAATNMVEVSFLVSFALVIPAAGWLADRFGTRRVFLGALAVFTLASGLCGAATTAGGLVAARVLQGLAGGMLAPVGMAMLFRSFPPEERLGVSRFLMLPTTLAPALGPILGGFLTDHLSWRWVFWINLPLGLATVLFGLLALPEHVEEDAGRFDLRGFALATPGLGLLMFALGEGAARGWGDPLVLGAGLLGACLLALLIPAELRSPAPMLDLRLLADAPFRSAALVAVLASGGLLGMLYVFPLMYQDALGATALDAGLTVFPESLGLMLATAAIGWSFPRLGARRVMALGLLGAAAAFVLMSRVAPGTSPWAVRALLLAVGFFLGHAVLAVQTVVFDTIADEAMGRASSLLSVLRQIGGAAGVAASAAVLAASGGAGLGAYQAALLASVAFLGGALLFALQIRPAPAPQLRAEAEPSV
ncbi:DHA2 family efflux MFS transporter permease subunit [Chloroflexia bacterium SDU3-3]|nr:DHA2 family efflux MFS transporter permease subunit [Chloroflexia bacterium SDU3-3]